MSDVKRDEFEAWAQNRAARSPAGFHPRLLKRHDLDPARYAISWVDSAFEGWQASRECLVIELPDVSEMAERAANGNCYSAARLDQHALVIKYIHAAGVKTK